MEDAHVPTRQPKVRLLDAADKSSGYPAPYCQVSGAARGSFEPGHSLWVVKGALEDGATLAWGEDHGDEAIYVLSGALAAGERLCEAGGSVQIEAGVAARLRAVGATELVHFGPQDARPPATGPLGPAQGEDHALRIVGEREAALLSYEGPDQTVYEQRFFADGTAPTSRITFFSTASNKASFAPPHQHSQDEIIHVLSGELHVGTLVVAPGASIAIAGDARYSFTAPGPFLFLNYRRDVSYISAPDHPPMLETVAGMKDLSVPLD